MSTSKKAKATKAAKATTVEIIEEVVAVETPVVETPTSVEETPTPVEETPTPVEETQITPKRRGRPVVEGCTRQKRLAEMAARKESGGYVGRGRPTNGESARQKKFAQRQALIEAGIVIKPGRPKMVVNPVVNVEVNIPAQPSADVPTQPEVLETVES